jgi:hypothetical protein
VMVGTRQQKSEAWTQILQVGQLPDAQHGAETGRVKNF